MVAETIQVDRLYHRTNRLLEFEWRVRHSTIEYKSQWQASSPLLLFLSLTLLR